VDILLFVFHGFLGALLSMMLWSKSYRDLYDYAAIRSYVVGAIVGYIYYYLYSEYAFPNAVMCIVAGYFGQDFVEALLSRFKLLVSKT